MNRIFINGFGHFGYFLENDITRNYTLFVRIIVYDHDGVSYNYDESFTNEGRFLGDSQVSVYDIMELKLCLD